MSKTQEDPWFIRSQTGYFVSVILIGLVGLTAPFTAWPWLSLVVIWPAYVVGWCIGNGDAMRHELEYLKRKNAAAMKRCAALSK